MICKSQMWQRAGFESFGNVAVDQFQSVAFSCQEVYIFVEFQQDRLHVCIIKVPCNYHSAIWMGRLVLAKGEL